MATKKKGRPTKKELEKRRIEAEMARKAEQKRTITASVLTTLGILLTALAFIEGDVFWKVAHRALFIQLSFFIYSHLS